MLPILTPTDFVALANQTLEFAYPSVEVEGEIKNFKISRGRWVYFDIADDIAKIRCFGTVYNLPGPLEDGMKIRIVSTPKLHPQFGFSLSIISIELSGEGTIKKAADLLQQKLEKEGLFALDRKRQVPYPPEKIGLITSGESAGYKDFIKVLSGRYGGINIELADVQVQGVSAPAQISRAIEWFSLQPETVDVLVIVRGGGSADDLQAYSTEQVVRAVSASRIPTVVAIGHEVDTSLAELAADIRASTPSNAAELLVPDRKDMIRTLQRDFAMLNDVIDDLFKQSVLENEDMLNDLSESSLLFIENSKEDLKLKEDLLETLSPRATLKRGYSVIRYEGKVIKSAGHVSKGDIVEMQLYDGNIKAKVE